MDPGKAATVAQAGWWVAAIDYSGSGGTRYGTAMVCAGNAWRQERAHQPRAHHEAGPTIMESSDVSLGWYKGC